MHSARLRCDLEKDFVPVSSSQPPLVAVLRVRSAPDCPCGCDVPCSTTRRLLRSRVSSTGRKGGDLHVSSLTHTKPTCPLYHEILAQKLTLLSLHHLWFTFKENKVICPLAHTTLRGSVFPMSTTISRGGNPAAARGPAGLSCRTLLAEAYSPSTLHPSPVPARAASEGHASYWVFKTACPRGSR